MVCLHRFSLSLTLLNSISTGYHKKVMRRLTFGTDLVVSCWLLLRLSLTVNLIIRLNGLKFVEIFGKSRTVEIIQSMKNNNICLKTLGK